MLGLLGSISETSGKFSTTSSWADGADNIPELVNQGVDSIPPLLLNAGVAGFVVMVVSGACAWEASARCTQVAAWMHREC